MLVALQLRGAPGELGRAPQQPQRSPSCHPPTPTASALPLPPALLPAGDSDPMRGFHGNPS